MKGRKIAVVMEDKVRKVANRPELLTGGISASEFARLELSQSLKGLRVARPPARAKPLEAHIRFGVHPEQPEAGPYAAERCYLCRVADRIDDVVTIRKEIRKQPLRQYRRPVLGTQPIAGLDHPLPRLLEPLRLKLLPDYV